MEPQIPFDPVSRRILATGSTTISSVYEGRAYYFENRQNRDAFETDPQKYLAELPALGQSIAPEGASSERPRRRRRGGC